MAALYIHIPFCHAKCAYCDFYSTPRTNAIEAVVKAIADEFKLRHNEITEPFRTLYIGGGTPSILSADRLEQLLAPMRPSLTEVTEFTIEANPEDITAEKAKSWRDTGVNRVSIGVQSLNDAELQAVGRRHTAGKAVEAIHTVHGAGIANISADLIFGLPGQTVETLALTLTTLLRTPLTHLSAYCLMFEPGTRIDAMRRAGKITEADDTTLEKMYRTVCDTSARAGFEHYEISNYAKPGYRSRHNSCYWDSTPYLGLGPAAHSFDGLVRRHNPSSIKKYLGSSHPTVIEQETEQERTNDIILTRLRTTDGLPYEAIPQQFRDTVLTAAAPHIASGSLLLSPEGRLTIPERHWLTADTIIRDLLLIDE